LRKVTTERAHTGRGVFFRTVFAPYLAYVAILIAYVSVRCTEARLARDQDAQVFLSPPFPS
jgi:hypothetical protein